MISIENILVSDLVVEKQFVCDLHKCKGGCCEDGEAGAPLQKDELDILDQLFEKLRPFLSQEGIDEIERAGRYRYDREFGWVTPTIDGKICAYGKRDQDGIIRCGIEQAFLDGKIEWKKPISCHLYPIKISKSRKGHQEYVNYEPREGMCNPACTMGKELKIPTFIFLKDALIRKYGPDFYEALEATANHINKRK